MEVKLIPYHNEAETGTDLIIRFWQAHDRFPPDRETAYEDLMEWTKPPHFLYFIGLDAVIAGFVHLTCGGRGADCHADIFVLPEFQGKDIDTRAIALAEEILKTHFESLYNGAEAENSKPARLYQEIGYSCRNAVAERKSYRLGKNGKL